MRPVWIAFAIACVGASIFIVAVAAFLSWNVVMGTLPFVLKFLVVALSTAITYFLFALLQSVRASYQVDFGKGSSESVALWRRRANRAWLVAAVILIVFAIGGLMGWFR